MSLIQHSLDNPEKYGLINFLNQSTESTIILPKQIKTKLTVYL